MHIYNDKNHVFHIEMSQEEHHHFCVIAENCDNMFVTDTASLLNFILTTCEQKWFLTVKEPELNGNPNSSKSDNN